MILRAALLVVILAFSSTSRAQDNDLGAAFSRDVLIVVASEHACYRFDIYLAVDRTQTRRGLMHVSYLPKMTGMLFVYAEDAPYSMWMKNTLIPLDMLFVRSDGRVSSIIRDTEPQSIESRGAIEPVRYVLEVNAGVTEKLSIDTDSRLIWGPMQADD